MPALSASHAIAKLQRWLRELHFPVLLTSSDASFPSPHPQTRDGITADSLSWTFHNKIIGILGSLRQTSTGTNSLQNPATGSKEPQSRPELHALPAKALENNIVEELEESHFQLSSGTLTLPEDWKRLHINLQLTEKSRNQLDHEAMLVYIREGRENSHYKWEADSYFSGSTRMANITHTTNGWEIGKCWWLLHVVSCPSILRMEDDQREVDRFIALCITGIFRMPDFKPPNVWELNHPLTPSQLDAGVPIGILVQMQLGGWEKCLLPIGFAAHRGKLEASTSLANTLQATLNLLILYFLSTRTSVDESLPRWLFLYGISYDNDGLRIFAHYPHLVDTPESSDALLDQPVQRNWGYVSVMVCDSLSECFTNQNTPKFNLANALLVIQGHTIYLMRKLKHWAGYHDLGLLIQCARVRKRKAKDRF